jgi:hypothetical protein
MSPLENPQAAHKIEHQADHSTPDRFQANSAFVLFLLSLAVYLVTRLIRLPDFPIYFFTDEAIQTQHAADLVANNFRSPDGIFLPTYFENGGQYNLSTSVYAQVIPYLLFGKSIWVTRGTSAILTLFAAIYSGLILRVHLKSRFWWGAPLLLTLTPAWFLHSRTAFETVLMASMYTPFLYYYLCYRQGVLKGLYPALVFGALAFYAYSPGQVIIVLTGLFFLIVDARFHWRHKRTALTGLVLLSLLALPYLRFMLTHENELTQHLTLLNSYWLKDIPTLNKVFAYFSRYLKGFNPFYWFWPRPSILERIFSDIQLPSWLFSNQLDLDRHTMKGYGHILRAMFPPFLIGLYRSLKRINQPQHRVLILAFLAAPSGAAVVDWGITRGMVFIIPATVFIAQGLENTFNWVTDRWAIKPRRISLYAFLVMAVVSFLMLGDSLENGPTWYSDYGMAGMQYSAGQVFSRAVDIAKSHPETTVLVSSTWTNGADVLLRFFSDDQPNLRMGNINAWGMTQTPLNRDMLFIMNQEDLLWIQDSGKFTNVSVEEIITYPDGSDGFYFVRLEYVPNIAEILAEEREARQVLSSETVTWGEIKVRVDYPTLDINEIQQAFDGDPTTLIRTLEANPLKLIISFTELTKLERIKVKIGGTPTRVTVRAFSGKNHLGTLTQQVGSSTTTRDITLSFEQVLAADSVEIEIFNPHDGEVAHVHLWEVSYE